MKFPKARITFAALLALGACTELDISNIQDISATEELRPPDAEPGACYGHEVQPAMFETVTEHVVVREATYDDTGSMLTPAAYRTDTVHRLVRERSNLWFKKPCPADMDEKFIASVQRALQARGLLAGRITGEWDQRTLRAVRKYQQGFGLDSGTLSLDSARKLGLVAVERVKS